MGGPATTYSAELVWERAKLGEAPAADRWRLWGDEDFWKRGNPDSIVGRLQDLEAHPRLRADLMWCFNQPGAGLAPTLRALLSPRPWFRPLTDPVVLGDQAIEAGEPPRALLQRWLAGASAPDHMTAAFRRYVEKLCGLVGHCEPEFALTETELDDRLCEALLSEAAATAHWLRGAAAQAPPERDAIDAVISAVPTSMWGMLRETRRLLAEWAAAKRDQFGAVVVERINGVCGYVQSDQVLQTAEELAGYAYPFVHEVWKRSDSGKKAEPAEAAAADILKRAGFFMNYAGALLGCAFFLNRDLKAGGTAARPAVVRWSADWEGGKEPRMLLCFPTIQVLVRLKGKERESDPILRCFPSSQLGAPVVDLALWAKRARAIERGERPAGELANRGWTMKRRGWQPELMRRLDEVGLRPDRGLVEVRGSPSRYQQETRALIRELWERP